MAAMVAMLARVVDLRRPAVVAARYPSMWFRIETHSYQLEGGPWERGVSTRIIVSGQTGMEGHHRGGQVLRPLDVVGCRHGAAHSVNSSEALSAQLYCR